MPESFARWHTTRRAPPRQPRSRAGKRSRRRIWFRPVYFCFDSAARWRMEAPVYKKTVRLLQRHSGLRLRIRGHSDAIGETDYNRDLSRRRAEMVKKYLLSKGIDKDRLEVEAVGESEPASRQDTRIGRALNRRVEFRIIRGK